MAWTFYVHPYKLAVAFLKNPEIAGAVAEKAADVHAQYAVLMEKLNTAAAAKPETGAGSTEDLKGAIAALQEKLTEAENQTKELKTLGAPVGWEVNPALKSCALGAVTVDCSFGAFGTNWTLPSIANAFWLLVGGLLVGLGAPFWAQAVSSLTASRDVSRRIAEIVTPNGVATATAAVPQDAAPQPDSVPVTTFKVARAAGQKKRRKVGACQRVLIGRSCRGKTEFSVGRFRFVAQQILAYRCVMSASGHAGYFLPSAAALALLLGLTSRTLAAEPVDIELVLAVDVSLSMSPDELEIQRHGYSAALTHESVLQAIADGAYGKIAVTYVEWAGATWQQVVVPWTVIASRADAERVAAQLSAHPPDSARRTSISGALQFGSDLFAESGFQGVKRVIDISGDGPNNQGAPVDLIRDQVIRQGITINGLPLMTRGGFSGAYDVNNLDRYYSDCVIGGPGAFMIPVNDWTQFPEAIRRKLVLELAGPASPQWAAEEADHPPVVLAQDNRSPIARWVRRCGATAAGCSTPARAFRGKSEAVFRPELRQKTERFRVSVKG